MACSLLVPSGLVEFITPMTCNDQINPLPAHWAAAQAAHEFSPAFQRWERNSLIDRASRQRRLNLMLIIQPSLTRRGGFVASFDPALKRRAKFNTPLARRLASDYRRFLLFFVCFFNLRGAACLLLLGPSVSAAKCSRQSWAKV